MKGKIMRPEKMEIDRRDVHFLSLESSSTDLTFSFLIKKIRESYNGRLEDSSEKRK
jgi:hypothetical protein